MSPNNTNAISCDLACDLTPPCIKACIQSPDVLLIYDDGGRFATNPRRNPSDFITLEVFPLAILI